MHPNAELVQRFYRAFNQKDGAAMSLCYAADAVFEDPAFGQLRGAEIGAMWRMLCSRATDLQVIASEIAADEVHGSAHWEADYTFSQTNRLVHNMVDAQFVFANGQIVEHRDRFDFWRWSRQALGAPGMLLGWSGFLHDKVRNQARANLKRYMESAVRP